MPVILTTLKRNLSKQIFFCCKKNQLWKVRRKQCKPVRAAIGVQFETVTFQKTRFYFASFDLIIWGCSVTLRSVYKRIISFLLGIRIRIAELVRNSSDLLSTSLCHQKHSHVYFWTTVKPWLSNFILVQNWSMAVQAIDHGHATTNFLISYFLWQTELS